MSTAAQQRRSIRIPGYDYSQPGAYFVTLAAHQKQHLFGDVIDGSIVLNDVGEIVRGEWIRSAQTRHEIELDVFVVMHNHVHGIVVFHTAEVANVPAAEVGAHGCAPRRNAGQRSMRTPRSLGSFVAGFKGAATARINVLRDSVGMPVWQRNYFERVIRSKDELERIRRYIFANPANWHHDPENSDASLVLRRPM